MSDFENNRTVTSDRRGRLWAWLTGAVVLVLVAVGVLFSTGRWGEQATRTGGSAPHDQISAGQGATQPGVPSEPKR
jgi:hypothetical protein